MTSPLDLRVAILTTETTHHAYFVRRIAETVRAVQVFEEREGVVPPFDTAHPFELRRDEFERAGWFDGAAGSLGDAATVHSFSSINDPACVDGVHAFAPDVTVVFGTGRVGDEHIARRPDRIVNLHGGDPEAYVGLDTHLWAIYHRDFRGLVTTLHRVIRAIDRGDIVGRASIPITPGMKLHELRRANTEVCVELTRAALRQLATTGTIAAAPQTEVGRTYSFMPSVLKDLCVARFERHTAELREAALR